LNDNGGNVDDGGNQGSVDNLWFVNDNWCRNFVLNWSLNSGPLRFCGSSLNWSGSGSLDWDWCRRSLDLSWNWSLYWNQNGEHDSKHLLNPETDNLGSQCIKVDVTSWLVNVCSNCSLGIQQRAPQSNEPVTLSHFQIFESFVQEF
jgi:hypothetical protein